MKKFCFSLFVMLLTLSASADVVYEPLIVDSGFNRDVIAENTSVLGTTISALYYSGNTSCFATQSVIAIRNAAWETSDNANYVITVRSGWPNDPTNNPTNRIIQCTSDGDVTNIPLYQNVTWQLAPYNELNSLCLRPTKTGDEELEDSDQNKGFQGEGTLKFKKNRML